MTPEIEHLGHACIRYSYKGTVITSDPWFYPAFLKAWFPYPDNRHLIGHALNSDYIYVSHAHEDHFDRGFLEQIDEDTVVIVPHFRSRYLENEVEKATGRKPVVLKHGESGKLRDGLTVTMFIDRSHKEDSALLIETPEGYRFLNSNDCELAISDWPGDIDLLACQFSGAVWYPQCYSYGPQEMARRTVEVRQSNFGRLCSRVRETGAKEYLPSAGPAAFLPPELTDFNGGIFTHWTDVEPSFKRVFPGVKVHPYQRPTELLSDYRTRRRAEWSSWYAEDDSLVTGEELNQHFLKLQQYNKRWLKNYQNDIYLHADGRGWVIKLGLLRGVLEEADEPRYFMDMPMRVLRAVVDGRCTWETALTSHRISLHRNPDVYDLKLMGLLNFGDRPVQTTTMAKQQEPKEYLIRDGYEHQRYCPHAGEDLATATIENGTITCPRHKWCWDASTGECQTGQGVPLKIRRIDD